MSNNGWRLKTLAGYQLNLRAAVYGLWSGKLDFDQVFSQIYSAIDRGLTQGWYEGAKQCGISPAELSPEERVALSQAIAQEKDYVFPLLGDVEANSKANGGKRTTLYNRLDPWVNRYRDMVNRAKIMACKDKKLRWDLGPTEHCSTCAKLASKVKRASYWQQRGIHPQQPPNMMLECGGWNCQCTLTPTNEPATPGPLPSVP